MGQERKSRFKILLWVVLAVLLHYTAIVTMQDLLGLGNEARMNYPSTVKNNWQWRAKPDYLSDELAEKIKYYTAIYQRLPNVKRGKTNVKNSK